MKRIILYILSIIFMSIGITFIAIYFNLFTFGYTILEYLKFILTNYYCLLFIVGFILLNILLIKK